MVRGDMGRDRRRKRAWGAVIGLVVPVVMVGAIAAPAESVGAVRASAVAAATVGGTPTIPVAPPGTTTGPVPHVPSGTLSLADRVIELPSALRCVKSIRVRFARPDGIRLHALKVLVGRRHVTRKSVPKSITLHSLPKGHFTLKVTVTRTHAKSLTRSRRYHSCG
jgi:hypothetical protein